MTRTDRTIGLFSYRHTQVTFFLPPSARPVPLHRLPTETSFLAVWGPLGGCRQSGGGQGVACLLCDHQ